ncbi:hypothetical protein WA158_000598 [Blastocystis sp. Blastoise]
MDNPTLEFITQEEFKQLDSLDESLDAIIKKILAGLKQYKEKTDQLTAQQQALQISNEETLHDLEGKYVTMRTRFQSSSEENEKLKSKIETLETSNKDMENTISEIETDQKSLANEITANRIQIKTLQEQLANTCELSNQRQDSIEKLKIELQKQIDENKDILKNESDLKTLLIDTQNKETSRQVEISSLKGQINIYMDQISSYKSQINTYNNTLLSQEQSASKEKFELLKQLNTFKSQSEEYQQKTNELEDKCGKWKDRALMAENNLKETELSNIQSKHDYEREIEESSHLIQLQKEKIEELSNQIAQKQELLNTLESGMNQNKQENKHILSELSQVQHKYELLLSENESYKKREKVMGENKKQHIEYQQGLFTKINIEDSLKEKGISVTDLLNKGYELENLLMAEKKLRVEAETYLSHVLQEIEDKTPELIAQRDNYQRILESNTIVTKKYEDTIKELNDLNKQLNKKKNELKDKDNTIQILRNENQDLGTQIQGLLRQRINEESMRSQNPQENSEITAGELEDISPEYPIYTVVEELQKENQRLKRHIFILTEKGLKLGKKLDKNFSINKLNDSVNISHIDLEQSILDEGVSSAVNDDNDDASANGPIDSSKDIISDLKNHIYILENEIKQLEEEKTKQKDMLTNIIKQRDIYKMIVNQVDTKYTQIAMNPEDENQVSVINSSMVDRDQEIEELKAENKKIHSTLTTQLESLQSRFFDISLNNERLKKQMEYIEKYNQDLKDNSDKFKETEKRLNNHIQDLESQIASLQDLNKQMEIDKNHANNQLESISISLKSKEEEVKLYKESQDRYKQKSEDLYKEKEILSELVKSVQKLSADLEGKYERENTRLSQSNTEEIEERSRNITITMKMEGRLVTKLESVALSSKTPLSLSNQKIDELNRKLKQNETDNQFLKSSLESSNAYIKDYQNMISALESSVKKITEEKEANSRDYTSQIKKLESRIEEEKKKIDSLVEENKQMIIERNQLLEKKDNDKNTIATLQSEITSKNDELSVLHKQYDELKQMESISRDALNKETEKTALFIRKCHDLEKSCTEYKDSFAKKDTEFIRLSQEYKEYEQLKLAEIMDYKSRLEEEEKRFKSIETQNTLLFSQLNSTKRRNSLSILNATVEESETNKKLADMRELVTILKRDKDIYISSYELEKQKVLRLKQQLDESEKVVEDMNTKLSQYIDNSHGDNVQENQSIIDQIKKEREENERQLCIYKESNNSLRIEKDNIEKEKEELTKKINQLESQMNPLSIHISELEGEIEGYKKQIEYINTEKENWKNRYVDYTTKFSRIDPLEYATLKEEVDKLNKCKLMYEEDIQGYEDTINDYKKDNNDYQQQINRFKQQLDSITKENTQNQQLLKQKQEDYELLKRNSQTTKDKFLKRLKELNTQVEEDSITIKQTKQQLETLQKSNDDNNHGITSLNKQKAVSSLVTPTGDTHSVSVSPAINQINNKMAETTNISNNVNNINNINNVNNINNINNVNNNQNNNNNTNNNTNNNNNNTSQTILPASIPNVLEDKPAPVPNPIPVPVCYCKIPCKLIAKQVNNRNKGMNNKNKNNNNNNKNNMIVRYSYICSKPNPCNYHRWKDEYEKRFRADWIKTHQVKKNNNIINNNNMNNMINTINTINNNMNNNNAMSTSANIMIRNNTIATTTPVTTTHSAAPVTTTHSAAPSTITTPIVTTPIPAVPVTTTPSTPTPGTTTTPATPTPGTTTTPVTPILTTTTNTNNDSNNHIMNINISHPINDVNKVTNTPVTNSISTSSTTVTTEDINMSMNKNNTIDTTNTIHDSKDINIKSLSTVNTTTTTTNNNNNNVNNNVSSLNSTNIISSINTEEKTMEICDEKSPVVDATTTNNNIIKTTIDNNDNNTRSSNQIVANDVLSHHIDESVDITIPNESTTTTTTTVSSLPNTSSIITTDTDINNVHNNNDNNVNIDITSSTTTNQQKRTIDDDESTVKRVKEEKDESSSTMTNNTIVSTSSFNIDAPAFIPIPKPAIIPAGNSVSTPVIHDETENNTSNIIPTISNNHNNNNDSMKHEQKPIVDTLKMIPSDHIITSNPSDSVSTDIHKVIIPTTTPSTTVSTPSTTTPTNKNETLNNKATTPATIQNQPINSAQVSKTQSNLKSIEMMKNELTMKALASITNRVNKANNKPNNNKSITTSVTIPVKLTPTPVNNTTNTTTPVTATTTSTAPVTPTPVTSTTPATPATPTPVTTTPVTTPVTTTPATPTTTTNNINKSTTSTSHIKPTYSSSKSQHSLLKLPEETEETVRAQYKYMCLKWHPGSDYQTNLDKLFQKPYLKKRPVSLIESFAEKYNHLDNISDILKIKTDADIYKELPK